MCTGAALVLSVTVLFGLRTVCCVCIRFQYKWLAGITISQQRPHFGMCDRWQGKALPKRPQLSGSSRQSRRTASFLAIITRRASFHRRSDSQATTQDSVLPRNNHTEGLFAPSPPLTSRLTPLRNAQNRRTNLSDRVDAKPYQFDWNNLVLNLTWY